MSNLEPKNPNDGDDKQGKLFFFVQTKYKETCLTCKIRKKKCSRDHPICSDCKRLKKTCVWIDDTMTIQQIRELKNKVESDEKESKLKRKLDIQVNKISGYKRKKKTNKAGSDQSVTVGEFNLLQFDQKDQSQVVPKIQKQNQKQESSSPESTSGTAANMPLITNTIDAESETDTHVVFDSGTQAQLSLISNDPKSWELTQQHQDQEVNTTSFTFFDDVNTFMEQNQLKLSLDSPTVDFSIPYDSIAPDNPRDDEYYHNLNRPNQFSVKKIKEKHSPDYHISPSFSPLFPTFDDFQTNTIPLPTSIPKPTPKPRSILKYPRNLPVNIDYELLGLDETGITLLDYYTNHLSKVVSIVPKTSNFYQSFFLPMALDNPGILNALLAWSSAHMLKGYEKETQKYLDKSTAYMKSFEIKTDRDLIQKLVVNFIYMAMEICRGDVTNWSKHLKNCSRVIKERGGLFTFNKTRNERFLISSFVYHDVLASSAGERGTYFPLKDYETFLIKQTNFGVDPLQGIVKPVFNIIAQISDLVFETKKSLNEALNSNLAANGNCILSIEYIQSDNFLKEPKKSSKYSRLLTIMQKTSILEQKINALKPDPYDLMVFNPKELELQMTLFELFQYTAKLHLRQSVLKLNPSSLETQFILCECLKFIDILLGTSVEGSLCFPMFIAGMNCTSEMDRELMLNRFNSFIERFRYKNLERAKDVVLKVWEIDQTGTKCVDWYGLVKGLDWDLSFA